MNETTTNFLFRPERINKAVNIVTKRGLSGTLGAVTIDLLDEQEVSADPKISLLLRQLNAINENVQNCSTIAYRINEMVFTWPDVNLVSRFCELDLTLLLAQIRAIYDYATEAVDAVFHLPGKVKAYHRTKYRELVRYCSKHEDIREFQTNAGRELLKAAKVTCSFGLMGSLRDKLLHEGARASVTFDLDKNPYVAVVSKQEQSLLPCNRFPVNVRSTQLLHFLDMRVLFSWLLLELAIFLDDIGEILLIALSTGKPIFRSIDARIAYRHERVICNWIEQLNSCVKDPAVRPSYKRLQVPNSMRPTIFGLQKWPRYFGPASLGVKC